MNNSKKEVYILSCFYITFFTGYISMMIYIATNGTNGVCLIVEETQLIIQQLQIQVPNIIILNLLQNTIRIVKQI